MGAIQAKGSIDQHHNRCAGENGAFCFVYLGIILHFPPFVKPFFAFFSTFLKKFFFCAKATAIDRKQRVKTGLGRLFSPHDVTYDTNVYRKMAQNSLPG
jgi:hypothetical protein